MHYGFTWQVGILTTFLGAIDSSLVRQMPAIRACKDIVKQSRWGVAAHNTIQQTEGKFCTLKHQLVYDKVYIFRLQ